MGHAIVVVGARKNQVLPIVQLRPNGQAFPFFRRLVAQRIERVGIQVNLFGGLAHGTGEGAGGRQGDIGDIGGRGEVDLVNRFVCRADRCTHADATVVALQHQELVVAQRHQ